MNNTYYINDGYFNSILNNYFNNKKWIQVSKDKSNNCTFNHTNREEKCSKCLFTNRFKSLKILDNKGNLYKTMQGKPYITNYFVFNNINELYKHKNLFNNDKYWLVKPQIGMRQQGIVITNKYSEIVNHVNKYRKGKQWVCMEYIANPMLYNGKKSHFRVYVLIVKRQHSFECYLFKNWHFS